MPQAHLYVNPGASDGGMVIGEIRYSPDALDIPIEEYSEKILVIAIRADAPMMNFTIKPSCDKFAISLNGKTYMPWGEAMRVTQHTPKDTNCFFYVKGRAVEGEKPQTDPDNWFEVEYTMMV